MDKKKLVIIGNGFDLYHGLKTSYSNYKEYLKRNHLEIIRVMELLFERIEYKGIEEEFWSNVESELSNVFNKAFDKYSDCTSPIYHDRNYIDKLMSASYSFTGELFIEWLQKTYYNWKNDNMQQSSDFSFLKENTLIVNFNYTTTLEDIYSVKKDDILYIHGDLEKLIEKHCKLQNIDTEDYRIKDTVHFDNNIVHNYIDFGVSQINMESTIKKLTTMEESFETVLDGIAVATKHIKENEAKLDNFIKGKSFEEIIILGHSLSGDDLVYYDKIIIPKCKKAKWTIYYYDNDDKKTKESFLLSRGIKEYTLRTYEDNI